MVVVDHFRATEVMNSIETEKCTAVHGVPSMFIFMMEHPDFAKYNLSSLRTGIMAGSPCPTELMKKAINLMNMKEITISYGQTEASPVITMTKTDDSIERRVATVGKNMPNIEVKIVDPETYKEVPNGAVGELCCRGYNVMKGYYKMDEATHEVIDKNGWLHTGDLATMDKDGYCRITGRIKDMVIRGGENIYPREIEELLYTHHSVSDVQVIGVPSEEFGEEIMACIILKENNVSQQDIKNFVHDNMARHKVPKYVRFMKEFPMTSSGKIQKYKLREWAVEEYGLQVAESIETA
jgi:fatty-acyl-CoA synthase